MSWCYVTDIAKKFVMPWRASVLVAPGLKLAQVNQTASIYTIHGSYGSWRSRDIPNSDILEALQTCKGLVYPAETARPRECLTHSKVPLRAFVRHDAPTEGWQTHGMFWTFQQKMQTSANSSKIFQVELQGVGLLYPIYRAILGDLPPSGLVHPSCK